MDTRRHRRDLSSKFVQKGVRKIGCLKFRVLLCVFSGQEEGEKGEKIKKNQMRCDVAQAGQQPRGCLLSALVVLLSCVACGLCSSSACECDTPHVRAVLSRFFFATGGVDWKNSSGWISHDPVCSWFGINCYGAGAMGIFLSRNNLTGSLPADLSKIAALQQLDLSDNRISGPLPPEWGAMKHLTVLYLYSNLLSGSLPPEWGSMPKLVWLYLGHNQLTGLLPPEWSAMRKIEGLYLDFNNFTGSLPVQWRSMPLLWELHLNGNNLNGSLPPQWGTMTQLRTLRLSYNEFRGPLPPQWGAMKGMVWLHLNDNYLSGSLPREWSAMTQIQLMSLEDNELSGSLPPEWCAMTEIQWLVLRSNRLSGMLPPQWSAMTQILQIDLSRNQITGSLPPEWSAMSEMERLHLDRNGLNGLLPIQWSVMAQLVELRLSSNYLTGPLSPCSFPRWNASFVSSYNFDFTSNHFSGRLQLPCLRIDPCSNKWRPKLDDLMLEGNRLCGVCSIECPCAMKASTAIESPNVAVVLASNSTECCSACSKNPECAAALYYHDTKYCALKNVSSPTVPASNVDALVLES